MKSAFGILATAAVLVAGSALAQETKTITIHNNTNWTITEVDFSSGPELQENLAPGDTASGDIPCGDQQLTIFSLDDHCGIWHGDPCADEGAGYVITNDSLADCSDDDDDSQ